MKPFTICPDCGENIAEFLLHKDNCPQFGKEVQEFIEAYDAEIGTWPEKAREQLDRLNTMHSFLFGKLFRTEILLKEAAALVRYIPTTDCDAAHVCRKAEEFLKKFDARQEP